MAKRLILLCLLAAMTGCYPEVYERKVSHLIRALEDVYQWHPQRGAWRSPAFQGLMQSGIEGIPELAAAITDLRPTRIHDRPDRVPVVGDITFIIALKITGLTVDDFRDIRIERDRHERNLIYAIKFPPGSRAKARDKLLRWHSRQ